MAISHLATAGSSAKQMSFDQATRSAAARTHHGHAWFSGAARQVPQPGGFGLAGTVLDSGMLTLPQLQAGDCSACGVGDERCVAQTLDGVEQL
jgi:hypothetical protein